MPPSAALDRRGARADVRSDKALIVGTGAESTRTCLQLTRDAAESRRGRGARRGTALLWRGHDDGRRSASHYLRIADASPVPVLLYNIPKYMHFAIDAALVAELAEHREHHRHQGQLGQSRDVRGVHEVAVAELRGAHRQRRRCSSHAMRPARRGGILAVALFAAALSLDVFDSVNGGDDSAAAAAQSRLHAGWARRSSASSASRGEGGDGSRRSRRRPSALAAASARRAQRDAFDELLESAELAAA